MQQTNISTRQLVTLIVCIVLAIGVGLWFLIPRDSTPQHPPATVATQEPIFAGTDALLNVGATSIQVDDLKFAVHTFLTQHPPVNQAVIVSSVQHQHIPQTTNEAYTFTLSIGDTDYAASLNTSGFTAAQLVLSKGGQSVFDSGVVDVSVTH